MQRHLGAARMLTRLSQAEAARIEIGAAREEARTAGIAWPPPGLPAPGVGSEPSAAW
jgi:hypothetical protein